MEIQTLVKKICPTTSGVKDVKIPEVWSPVLTSAKKAAEKFSDKTISTSKE